MVQEQLVGRVPPHNIEAEMCALGAMLLSERVALELPNILGPEDFYRPAHQEVFRAIHQLCMERVEIDLVTLRNCLMERGLLEQVGGMPYLIQIAESVPSASNAHAYAAIVRDKALLRGLQSAAHDVLALVENTDLTTDEKIDQAESTLFQVGQKRLGRDFADISNLAMQFSEQIDSLFETGEPMLGMPSGYADLDSLTSGFYGGDLMIVAARPAMGKTSLVLNFALNIARLGRGNVAIFSLEMSGKQLVQRMVSTLAGMPMDVLRRANLGDQDFQRLTDACGQLYTLPIHVDDSSDISPMEMRGKLRRLRDQGGLALVVIDYLQLMRGNRRVDNRVQELGDIARGIKGLAKDLDVPVIALSQLNRGVESRDNKRPGLSDIRESGSIEAEADLVMFIYREAYYERKLSDAAGGQRRNPDEADVAELIIGKHRNGPTGTVLLGFQPAYTRFTLLDEFSKSEYVRSQREKKSGGMDD